MVPGIVVVVVGGADGVAVDGWGSEGGGGREEDGEGCEGGGGFHDGWFGKLEVDAVVIEVYRIHVGEPEYLLYISLSSSVEDCHS